jgi:hypothetical protein
LRVATRVGKEILGIATFGFLFITLISCVTIDTSDRLRKGMSKTALEDILVFTTTPNDDPFLSPVSEWDEGDSLEILYAQGRKYFYVFTDVTRPTSASNRGNGLLHSWYPNLYSARAAVDKLQRKELSSQPKLDKPDPPKGRERRNSKSKKAPTIQ